MINKKIISSFLPTFFIASSIGIVIVIGFWMQGSSNADILSEQTSSEFKRALGANNEIFFKNISNNNENWGNEVLNTYPQKMDIEVIQNNNLLFFSFLGLKEKSSILHSVYGSWNAKTKKITNLDPIIFSVMEKKEKSITFTNNSSIAVPVDNNFLLIPNDVKGTVLFSGKLLMPGDSFIFQSEKEIPYNIFQIESLTYGYKALIK